MNKFKYILIIVIGFSLLWACEREEILFPADKAFSAFDNESQSVSEAASEPAKIPVYMAGVKGASKTVNFEIVNEGLDNIAIEGVDYILLNESRSLSYPDGVGYDTIYIETINNDIRDKDKIVVVKLLEGDEVDVGINQTKHEHQLIISDDEHPLSELIGTYDVFSKAAFSGWNDYRYEVISAEYPDDDTKLYLINFLPEATDSIVAIVNVEEKTMAIETGQSLGDLGYGPANFMHMGLTDQGQIFEIRDPMLGVYDENGNMIIDAIWGPVVSEGDNEGYIYNYLFYTSEWTKRVE